MSRKYYNRTNTCDRCSDKLIPQDIYRELNKDGNWTGNWVCHECHFSDLLEHLKRFYEENGRPPAARDFINNPKYPSFNSYQNRFGSWNSALKLAGLQTDTRRQRYTDNELLEYLQKFYKDTGKVPTYRDFINNSRYSSFTPYINRFGGWQKALKLAGLDVESMIRNGIIETVQQKARLFELYTKKHFENESEDLSGKNCNSPYDGICPKGQTYDAKSSKLHYGQYWLFHFENTEKEDIQWYYLGAFDKDYRKLLHAWRILGDFIDKDSMIIGMFTTGTQRRFTYNVENMKEFEITDKFNFDI